MGARMLDLGYSGFLYIGLPRDSQSCGRGYGCQTRSWRKCVRFAVGLLTDPQTGFCGLLFLWCLNQVLNKFKDYPS